MRAIESGNVVIVAQSLNPSVFSELWLVRNGILEEGIRSAESFFSPVAARVTTADFELLVLPERLQFAPGRPTDDAQQLVHRTVGRIVELLPHTPYRAFGINFEWSASTEDQALFCASIRRMFVPEASEVHSHFSEPDARFGGYLSKDALGFRLRLDIKPISRERDGIKAEGLLYHFNFNLDLCTDRPADEIQEGIGKWGEARRLSQEIFESTTGWCEP